MARSKQSQVAKQSVWGLTSWIALSWGVLTVLILAAVFSTSMSLFGYAPFSGERIDTVQHVDDILPHVDKETAAPATPATGSGDTAQRPRTENDGDASPQDGDATGEVAAPPGNGGQATGGSLGDQIRDDWRFLYVNQAPDPLRVFQIGLGFASTLGAAAFLVISFRKSLRDQRGEIREDDQAFTDNYGKASSQIASRDISEQLAGIYAIANLAKDSMSDAQVTEPLERRRAQQCIDMICSYLRLKELPSNPYDPDLRNVRNAKQAALDQLFALLPTFGGHKDYYFDLREADLRGLDFHGQDWNIKGHIVEIDMSNADLTNSNLDHTNLMNARIDRAKLDNASFDGVYWTGLQAEPLWIANWKNRLNTLIIRPLTFAIPALILTNFFIFYLVSRKIAAPLNSLVAMIFIFTPVFIVLGALIYANQEIKLRPTSFWLTSNTKSRIALSKVECRKKFAHFFTTGDTTGTRWVQTKTVFLIAASVLLVAVYSLALNIVARVVSGAGVESAVNWTDVVLTTSQTLQLSLWIAAILTLLVDGSFAREKEAKDKFRQSRTLVFIVVFYFFIKNGITTLYFQYQGLNPIDIHRPHASMTGLWAISVPVLIGLALWSNRRIREKNTFGLVAVAILSTGMFVYLSRAMLIEYERLYPSEDINPYKATSIHIATPAIIAALCAGAMPIAKSLQKINSQTWNKIESFTSQLAASYCITGFESNLDAELNFPTDRGASNVLRHALADQRALKRTLEENPCMACKANQKTDTQELSEIDLRNKAIADNS